MLVSSFLGSDRSQVMGMACSQHGTMPYRYTSSHWPWQEIRNKGVHRRTETCICTIYVHLRLGAEQIRLFIIYLVHLVGIHCASITHHTVMGLFCWKNSSNKIVSDIVRKGERRQVPCPSRDGEVVGKWEKWRKVLYASYAA